MLVKLLLNSLSVCVCVCVCVCVSVLPCGLCGRHGHSVQFSVGREWGREAGHVLASANQSVTMQTTHCRRNHAAAPAATVHTHLYTQTHIHTHYCGKVFNMCVQQRGGACGAHGHPARSPVEGAESGRGRDSAPVLLSVAWPVAVLQRRQTTVQHTRLVQVTCLSVCLSVWSFFVSVCPSDFLCLSPPFCLSVHGGWSGWSSWDECSGSCIDDQRDDVIVPSKVRYRSCSNPAPSNDTAPPGNGCPGDNSQIEFCSELPNCPGETGSDKRSGTVFNDNLMCELIGCLGSGWELGGVVSAWFVFHLLWGGASAGNQDLW